jgi:hypothetical protein
MNAGSDGKVFAGRTLASQWHRTPLTIRKKSADDADLRRFAIQE